MIATEPKPSRLYGPKRENVISDMVRQIAKLGGRVEFTSAQIGSVIVVRKGDKSMNLHGTNALDAAQNAFRTPALWRFLTPANDKPPRKAVHA